MAVILPLARKEDLSSVVSKAAMHSQIVALCPLRCPFRMYLVAGEKILEEEETHVDKRQRLIPQDESDEADYSQSPSGSEVKETTISS